MIYKVFMRRFFKMKLTWKTDSDKVENSDSHKTQFIHLFNNVNISVRL